MSTNPLYDEVNTYLESLLADGETRAEYINRLTHEQRLLRGLVNLHSQVYNGGFSQWGANGYAAEDYDTLITLPDTFRPEGDDEARFRTFMQMLAGAHVAYNDYDRAGTSMESWYEDLDVTDMSEDSWEMEMDRHALYLDAYDDQFYSDEMQITFNQILVHLLQVVD